MEENDVKAIIKNAIAEAKKLEDEEKTKKGTGESFNCPECGTPVSARQKHCGSCGVELDWED